jgi:hypothetical protein
MLLVLPKSYAGTTVTLLSQDFSTLPTGGGPPSDWTDYSGCSFGPNYYGGYSGWYADPNGAGGGNGSLVCDMWDYAYGPIYTPMVDASAFGASTDSVTLDFDFYFEYNYYNQDYGEDDYFYVNLNNSSGQQQILSCATSSDYTFFDQNFSWYPDPPTSSSDWRHYHFVVPANFRTSDLQVSFDGEWSASLSDCAIDNVVITASHNYKITYSPQALDFGLVLFGSGPTSPKSIVVTNPNPAPLSLGTPVLGGASPSDYSITRAPTSIAPYSVDSFLVVFSPVATGVRNASITVSNNSDGPTTIAVNLTGKCVAPTISVTPTLLFAGMPTRLHHTLDQYVLVTASGAGSLTISPTSNITGDYPGEYQILRVPSLPIPAGSSDTIWVRYAPTIEGAHYGVLNIVTNAVNGTQSVQLHGIGILPRLVVTPSPLNFDSVALGTTQCDSIQLWNPGTDTISITHNFFSSADGDFQLTPLTGTDTLIPADGKKYIKVCFSPAQSGTRQARLRITTNIPLTFDTPSRDTSSFYVNIVGEGVPYGVLSIGGTPVVDSEIIGQQLCTTDTLFNYGSSPLTISQYTITGANAGEYSITGVTLPITIQPGGKYVFNVCITPTARGDRNAMLNISSTTNGKLTTAQLRLDVFGQAVCASVGSQTAGFPLKTCVGSTDTAWVTVTNCGDVLTTYTSSLSASTTMYAIIGAVNSAPISNAGATKVGVVFTPTARGAAPGTLTITGTGGVTETVTLDGSGGAASITGTGTADLTQVGTSTSFAATITNAGECDWSPGVPTIAGANAADFTCTGVTTKVIPAGASDTLTFSYHPTGIGTSSAVATFPTESEASLPTPASVTLSGLSQTQGVTFHAEANGFSLGQNYPNPFNPMTEIRFTLPQDSHVQLDIVDMTGRIVRNVLDERMTAGNHGTVIDASELASGVYFYQLSAGSVKLTRQMMLAK